MKRILIFTVPCLLVLAAGLFSELYSWGGGGSIPVSPLIGSALSIHGPVFVAAGASAIGYTITCPDTGTAAAYTCDTSPSADPGINPGYPLILIPANANTSSPQPLTLGTSSPITGNLLKFGCTTATEAGDFVAGEPFLVIYDGTNFCLQSPTATGH